MATITLSGYVYDSDGNGVAGLEARAFAVNHGGKASTAITDTTDSTGRWTLTGLNTDMAETGTFSVRIRDLSTNKTRWIDPTDIQVNTLYGPDGLAPIGANAITTAMLQDDAVTEAKLHPDVVAKLGGGSSGGGLGPNTVTSSHIVDGTIQAADLADSAVTTNKLANLAVTSSKLASNAVTTSKILDNQVTEAKLSAAVRAKLNSGGGLTANSVTSDHIVNGTIQTVDLGNAIVTESKLANNSVTSAKLASNAVTNAKIANSAVSEAKLDSAVRAKLNASSGASQNLLFYNRVEASVNLSSSGTGTVIQGTTLSLGGGTWLFHVLADLECTSTSGGPYTVQMDLYAAGTLLASNQGLAVATLAPRERITLHGIWYTNLASGSNILQVYAKAVTGLWKSNGCKIYAVRVN